MSKRAYIFCLVVFIIGFLAAYIVGVEIGTKEGDNLKEKVVNVSPDNKSDSKEVEGYWVKGLNDKIVVYKIFIAIIFIRCKSTVCNVTFSITGYVYFLSRLVFVLYNRYLMTTFSCRNCRHKSGGSGSYYHYFHFNSFFQLVFASKNLNSFSAFSI